MIDDLLIIEERPIMSMKKRILLSLGIMIVDLGVFFLPLTALFLIYILFYNPAWFREFLEGLDRRPDDIRGDRINPSKEM